MSRVSCVPAPVSLPRAGGCPSVRYEEDLHCHPHTSQKQNGPDQAVSLVGKRGTPSSPICTGVFLVFKEDLGTAVLSAKPPSHKLGQVRHCDLEGHLRTQLHRFIGLPKTASHPCVPRRTPRTHRTAQTATSESICPRGPGAGRTGFQARGSIPDEMQMPEWSPPFPRADGKLVMTQALPWQRQLLEHVRAQIPSRPAGRAERGLVVVSPAGRFMGWALSANAGLEPRGV